ncbi:dimethylaniline monooxygenase [Sinorhizobium glycinis]|uniref:Trimethylamine monooxygenase n=1 Tax=Sinorhizobium glycinis TaxID=1472378 RepID=A0A178XN51_9HYPH|nr:FAD-dependent oxidoreductase [Sinorhizobium glycinis]OAP36647.1 dimethylaniline monooxygenase [Sinorhizobium glycinis]
MQDDRKVKMPENAVAVIGAGPGGLAVSRWLGAHGLVPVIFETAPRLGGQWNSASATSATWPGMRTNTSRIMTAFSDLDHAPGTPTYVRQEEMLNYLERYAFTFGLLPHLRLGTRVERLERAAEGAWLIRSVSEEETRTEIFRQVVVATGRHNLPHVPDVAGLKSFGGALGISHTAQYTGAERYRGRNVVVAGCSISALEIASDLALSGAGEVVSTNRRQRYILPKLIAGVPTDHVMFTRAAALLGEVLPPEELAAGMRSTVVKAAGRPDQFGAPAAAENIFAAGISQSQHFLVAVAEGRITTRPWIERIEGRTVRFSDGSTAEADGLLFGTGYRLSLPWLSEEIAETIGHDGSRLDLHHHTFHPDLSGLAFLGLYDLIGPYFPVLELQARWIAYCLAGRLPLPSPEAMRAGVEEARAMRSGPPSLPMHVAALIFARNAGIEPDLDQWPELERSLLFGPLSPVSFRLRGPDAQADAPAKTLAAAAAFGAIEDDRFTPEEEALWRLIGPRTARTAA